MSVFYAFLSRMRYITRWGLMRNTRAENVMEHSAIVAMFAHALAVIHNKQGGSVDANKVGMMALYHETGEVITGDMPTPIKYFNPEITSAYKAIEEDSEKKLLSTLPEDLAGEVGALVMGGNETELKLVKYADTLSAYVKCLEEISQGNAEFKEAEASTKRKLQAYESKEVDYFMERFVTPFGLSLDNLSKEIK
ncbi:MAG: 5'-deoxynucleotidase [Clostridia bacterium]|nr:5'-deoxynucleotidase [Clostridia bacterium]